MRVKLLGVVMVLGLILSAPAGGMAFTFNTIDVPNAISTWVAGINNVGQIVGYFFDGTTNHGFLKDGPTFTIIAVPGASFTLANGIIDAGQIVGVFGDSSGSFHGFLKDGPNFTTINGPCGSFIFAQGINNTGQIVGLFEDPPGSQHGFLLNGTTFTTIDVPGASFTSASGINDAGQIVGNFSGAEGNAHGFLREGTTFTPIVPCASYSYNSASGINNAGQIVGGLLNATNGRFDGFLKDGPTFTIIAVPGASFTLANGINDAGQIVGVFEDSPGSFHGFATSGTAPAPLAPALLWGGLKNSDDQGTQFDLRAEVYINGTLVAFGETLCVMGITRIPANAKEMTVPFCSISDEAFESEDALSLKILTRIGTNPDGTKCPGHSNAVGLRLYYDAISRPSRFGAELSPDSLEEFFLHSSSGNDFLDDTAPTATTAKFKDSASVNFAGGNPWKAIGTWSMTLP